MKPLTAFSKSFRLFITYSLSVLPSYCIRLTVCPYVLVLLSARSPQFVHPLFFCSSLARIVVSEELIVLVGFIGLYVLRCGACLCIAVSAVLVSDSIWRQSPAFIWLIASSDSYKSIERRTREYSSAYGSLEPTLLGIDYVELNCYVIASGYDALTYYSTYYFLQEI